MATLMGDNPDTGCKEAIPEAVDGPEDHARGGVEVGTRERDCCGGNEGVKVNCGRVCGREENEVPDAEKEDNERGETGAEGGAYR